MTPPNTQAPPQTPAQPPAPTPGTINIRLNQSNAQPHTQPAAAQPAPNPVQQLNTQTVKLPQTMPVDRQCIELFQHVRPYTMVDIWIYHSLYRALDHVLDAEIPGSIVECGVWRGGCVMFMAMMMLKRNQSHRDIYLYDTYTGMTQPTEHDFHMTTQQPASDEWNKRQTPTHTDWCYASLEEVKQNVLSTGYPENKLHFVKGPVEQTIPQTIPDRIALLRLDTDFYDSTLHELNHLYPRLSLGGAITFDDYGTWAGQRKAIHHYFQQNDIAMLLQCASTCATGIKAHPKPGPTIN